MAAPPPLPKSGNVFVSVKDVDKPSVIPLAREFVELGFQIISTSGTWAALKEAGVPVTKVHKIREGRPNVLDLVTNRDIDFIINTPSGKIPREDEVRIRNASLAQKIPIMTTVRAAQASANARAQSGASSRSSTKLAVNASTAPPTRKGPNGM
jgi:carbamoyl-phosphate synthase large subunit